VCWKTKDTSDQDHGDTVLDPSLWIYRVLNVFVMLHYQYIVTALKIIIYNNLTSAFVKKQQKCI